MTWNYRVIRHYDGTLALHEVFYTDTGMVNMYSENPTSFLSDSIEGLSSVLEMAKAALSKSIIDIKDLPGYVSDPNEKAEDLIDLLGQ